VVRRETNTPHIQGHIGDPNGSLFLDNGADQPKTNRRVRHLPDFIRSHANGDKVHKFPVFIQHPQGSVTRSSLLTGELGNPFQDHFQGQVADQLETGAMQSHEPGFDLLSG
jgi:hypothetical protein